MRIHKLPCVEPDQLTTLINKRMTNVSFVVYLATHDQNALQRKVYAIPAQRLDIGEKCANQAVKMTDKNHLQPLLQLPCRILLP